MASSGLQLSSRIAGSIAIVGLAFWGDQCWAQDRTTSPTPLVVTRSSFVPPPVSATPRPTAFISDLHLGLGKQPDGRWWPKKDFRWTNALFGFLDELSKWGEDRVDLVIVGDFLELW